jgi:D-alanyl-D-alanine carboxypeptidase
VTGGPPGAGSYRPRHGQHLLRGPLPARVDESEGTAGWRPVDATNWNPTFAGAAGQIVSDLHDALTWTRALGTGSLLEPATQQSRLPNPASASGPRSYDFAIGTDNGWLMHSGELPGFNTQVAYLPGADITIVVLANADIANGKANPAPAVFSALASAIAPDHAP